MPNTLIYCENCTSWKGLQVMEDVDYMKCTYVVSVDPNHPVKPQKVYGDFEVLNKDNNCPHFNDKGKGMEILP